MKKLVSLLLAVILLTATCTTIAAADDYASTFLAAIFSTTDEALEPSNRAIACTCALLDYIQVFDGTVDDVQISKDFKIGKNGSFVDVFIPRNGDGSYYNIFWHAASNDISLYKSLNPDTATSSEGVTYYSVPGSEVLSILEQLVSD